MKTKCSANNPETIPELNAEIYAAIADLRSERIEHVLKNYVNRMEYCQVNRDGHLFEITFHKYVVFK